MPGNILIVEDLLSTRFFLSQALLEEGYNVHEAGTAAEALDRLSQQTVDLVILDLRLPDRSGMELLPEIMAHDPDLPVIFLTAHGSVQEAVQAMKLRACDFIAKPPDLTTLKHTIAHLLRNTQLQREVERLRSSPSDSSHPFVIGKTRSMARTLEMVERVAPTSTSVLICGENGTGKERIANLIHARSPRANKPFVPINCAAIPENLLESELFGSVRGAFTNATARKGLIEQAHGGTLFLDEISAMKPDMQVKLLRVLEDKTVRRLGATTDIKVDVRIIAASNRDLKAMIEQGTFREDLYYRLAVFTIVLPPLRERVVDIPDIAAAYIDYFNRQTGRSVQGLTPEALACLEAHDWPGNIRELRNLIERAVILAEGDEIGLKQLPPEVTRRCLDATARQQHESNGSKPLPSSLLELEQRLISEALDQCGGDVAAAAQVLGITQEELRRRLDANN